ncbi:DUF3263 domain-containing protein [Hamadaea tsunoensis]|uniref:DUF3263 domain-containing protein n=1 Tax=Hamadaea tsunoensis TaxID=53368 RepID=UPI000415CF88|nr:DUF3263 domain-containing protein [Hamadaea tsunoensis]
MADQSTGESESALFDLIPGQRRLGEPPPSVMDDEDRDESDDILDSDLPERIAPVRRTGLSEVQQGILGFERQWWRHAGAKEQAIRETFDFGATRYYQLLNRLLDDPRAVEYDAVLVYRLRRLRMTRSRSRA